MDTWLLILTIIFSEAAHIETSSFDYEYECHEAAEAWLGTMRPSRVKYKNASAICVKQTFKELN